MRMNKMRDFKEEAKAHWKYTEGIIRILFRIFLKLAKYLYIQAMIHGYKHGKEDAN